MVRVRYATVLIALLSLAASASAQQEKKPKAFTNDDLGQSAPSTPAAAAPANKKPDATLNEAAPGTGPQAALTKVREFQAVLLQNRDLYVDKLMRETDADHKQRWKRMVDSLGALLRDNETTITELQESTK